MIPIQAKYPLNDAIRQKKPIFMETHEQIVSKYPSIAEFAAPTAVQAFAVVPFLVQDRVVGGISFSYDQRSNLLSSGP